MDVTQFCAKIQLVRIDVNVQRFVFNTVIDPFENYLKGTTVYPGTETEKKPKCVDINECLNTKPVCSPENECQNTFGSYYCECNPGYEYNEETETCDDLVEFHFRWFMINASDAAIPILIMLFSNHLK